MLFLNPLNPKIPPVILLKVYVPHNNLIFEEFGRGSTNNPLIDLIISLFFITCLLDIVSREIIRRNSVLVTYRVEGLI